MTSKLVVNTIEADTGISSVSFASSISLSSTSVFHLGDAGFNIGADTNINRPGNGVIGFNINSSEKLRIDSNGRLLLGTITEGHPAADDFTIANTANAADMGITLRSADNGQGAIYFSDGTSGADEYRGIINYNHTNNYFSFFTDASEKLRITSGGQIGINQTNPARALTVNALGTGTSSRLVRLATQDNSTRFDFSFENTDFLTIQNGVNDSAILKLHKSGYVTKPSQPMVGCRHFYQNGNNVYNDGNNVYALTFHNVDVNIGNHFNNTTGIFTCPVAGNYFISCQINLRATNNAWSSVYIIYKPNGGSYQKLSDNWASSAINNTWAPISASHLCNCNAGDEIVMAYNSGYSAPNNSTTSGGVQMSIFLFG